MGQLSIATWNAEWISRRSGRFESARTRIAELDGDILVLTETSLDLIPEGRHSALGGDDWGYPRDESRRKVALWSKWPIEGVDNESVQPPGRHVAATISAPDGPLRVNAVCVPWRDAHVSTGRRDATPWSEHLAFLASLRNVLEAEREDPDLAGLPVVLAGDFNQRSGDSPYGNEPTQKAWRDLLDGLDLEEVTPANIIDKVALSSDFRTAKTVILDPDGISDHHAVKVEAEVR